MGREEFCITCRAADPDCELHYYDTMISASDCYYDTMISASDWTLLATYNPKNGTVDVFVPRKHKWEYNVNAETLFRALNYWWRARA